MAGREPAARVVRQPTRWMAVRRNAPDTARTGMPSSPGEPSGRAEDTGAATGVSTPAQPGAPPLGGEHDRELVRRIARSDPSALGELYDRWSAAVYAVGMCILGAPDDAEEVLESTFWQVWRSAREQASSGTCVGAWLLGTAHGRALDRLRTRAMDGRRGAGAEARIRDRRGVAP
jgi:hypothetical protein